jgi:2-polyprenyl-6-methoxyphenol hydroxylase-like FAD-dependent oxidoreductase
MVDINKPLDIVVVGGSLSALFTSLPLLRLPSPRPKHRITILERSPTPLLHDQGAGVVAGGDTLAFFEKHDIFGREIAVESRERLYLDKEGGVIDRESWKQRMTSWDLLYYLARGGLDGTESEYVDRGEWEHVRRRDEVKEAWGRAKYEYGREVLGVEEKGEIVEVKWKSTREGEADEEGTSVADFVICADGPSSKLKGMMVEGASTRVYAGYVAFRGTVPETELSESAKEVFVERFTFYHADGVQILAYTIPGAHGSLEEGERKVNWVWYWNCSDSSDEYREILTDVDGNYHRFTLPTGGKMQEKVWDRQKQRAKHLLPPQFGEIVERTEKPFVQAITDVEPLKKGTKVGRLLNGKAALVGDALAGFRPHTAASTSQAAFDALMLERVFRGDMAWDEYEKRLLDFAWSWQQRGVMLGERSQFGRHPLAHGGSGEEVSRNQLHMR